MAYCRDSNIDSIVITVSGKAWLASTSWSLLIAELDSKETELPFPGFRFSATNPMAKIN
jgi:hypothetical protein